MRFRTRDVTRVEETWKQYVPSAALRRVDPQRFHFAWHSAELNGVSLVRYELAAEVHSTAEPHNQFLACRVQGSHSRVHAAREDLAPDRPWLSDGARVDALWEGSARVTALVIDRDYLQTLGRQISGNDRLSLYVTDLGPHTAHRADLWNRMFAYVDHAVIPLDHDDIILRHELARHAALVTLSTFPTTMPHAGRHSAQTTPAPKTVRLAQKFIDENAHLPITVDDVAAAAHISTRGLQYAFRRTLDSSPGEYLRRARLDGAHRELRLGPPSTVTAVARRWGFSHPSRFASLYREAFGVLPSVTARQNR